jgi:hypothetical protein
MFCGDIPGDNTPPGFPIGLSYSFTNGGIQNVHPPM